MASLWSVGCRILQNVSIAARSDGCILQTKFLLILVGIQHCRYSWGFHNGEMFMHQSIPAVPPQKCLKQHHSTVRSIKNVAVLMEDRHLPSFFISILGDSTAQESPPPGICHPRQRINANARRSAAGGWAQLELTDALQGEG